MEPGVYQGGFDSLPALLDSRVRHAHRDEVAHPGGVHVHFDIDEVGVNTENRGAFGSKECQALRSVWPEGKVSGEAILFTDPR
jgi:hypothetical protein